MITAPFLAILISVIVLAITMQNWRYGLLAVIPIGVLQDVLRKMTPDAPAYYIVWSSAIFFIVVFVALSRHSFGIRSIWLGDRQLKGAFYLFFLLVLIQLAHSLFRWGQPAIPLFGAIFYFGPIVALVLMIAFARQTVWIKRFINIYLWTMIPACLSVYLSLLFKDSIPILRDVGSFSGQELIIFDVGAALYSYPGLFRVGEIAAFHAATCVAFLSIFMMKKRQQFLYKLGLGVLILLLVGAIVLTGRRKMLMALSIFWVLQFFLMSVLSKGQSRMAVSVLVMGLLFSVGVGFFGTGESSLYLERGGSVFSSVDERGSTAIMLFESAINRSDGIGLGAGIASQGSRFAGIDNSKYVGGSSEAGIGFLIIELGIPGIIIVGWLGFNIIRVLMIRLKFVAKVDYDLLLYAVSFAALLAANALTFMVATQLYGDYFVLIILGVIAGMLYATIYQAMRIKAALIRYEKSGQHMSERLTESR